MREIRKRRNRKTSPLNAWKGNSQTLQRMFLIGKRKSSWRVKGRPNEMHPSLAVAKSLNRIVQVKTAEGITTLFKAGRICITKKAGS